ncbi:FolC bifunctional protein, partial [Amniculicola lignicola CBS 123094]
MIQPGLERIGALLKNVHFPWKAIHVAGTNGKGSICASTSALLTRRNIKNGRFTSPHIIDRWDCITVNDKPVGELRFKTVERHFIQLSERENINASPFEILTASAFQIFNDSNIDVGVVEVGMGGKLDATNILNNQVVSVISKIAHDHQSFLGHTLQEIAKHKAGILRPSIPYILNPRNDISVRLAVDDVAKEVGAGPLIDLGSEQLRTSLYSTPDWVKAVSGMSTIQRDNLALAYSAFFTALTSMKESTSKAPKLLIGVTRKGLPGRYQMQKFTRMLGAFREILVDGAHNRDAAKALDDYVSKKLRQRDNIIDGDAPRMVPVTWVIAMSEGKQVIPFLQALLRPGDMIVTTTFGPVDGMPWVKPMKPNSILKAAKNIIPDILGLCNNTPEVYRAVATAKYLTEGRNPIVVTGSLYLVGDLLRD